MKLKCSLLRAFVLTAGISFATLSGAFALEASALFDADTYKELKEKGYVERSFFGKEKFNLSLYPDSPLGRMAKDNWPANKDNPTFVVEEAYLISKKELGNGNYASLRAFIIIQTARRKMPYCIRMLTASQVTMMRLALMTIHPAVLKVL